MFKSWQSYTEFERTVMRDRRYIRAAESEEFLNSVRATAAEREKHLKKGSIFWRAQLGYSWRQEGEGDGAFEVECALGPLRMKPLRDRASEGRANPKGIPCLYLATTKETAAAEVRPWIGSYFSVAQFETDRRLHIIDCSHNYGHPSYYFSFERKPQLSREEIENAVWSNIDKAFARPVGRDDDVAAYVPTQIIAELVRSEGYDGLAYRSNFGDGGYNIALFDIDAANVLNCQLGRVDAVKIEFSMQDNPYFVNR